MNQIENMATQQKHVEEEVEKAYVLWDLGNCPIPDGRDPLEVVRKIQMAVEKLGHVRRNGQITFTAIGSKLTEIPGEDVMRRLLSIGVSVKHAHHYDNDYVAWSHANPPPSTIMIIDSHERIGWIARQLSEFEDKGFRILLAYPQRDIATPFPRTFSRQLDWDALASDERETTTTTSLVITRQYPLACEVCFVAVKTVEHFTAHLRSVEHEYNEWEYYACKNNVDRTILSNLPFGRSPELDLLLNQDLHRRSMLLKERRQRGPRGYRPRPQLD